MKPSTAQHLFLCAHINQICNRMALNGLHLLPADISGERGCALCKARSGKDAGLQIEFVAAAPAKSGLSWANSIHGAECFVFPRFNDVHPSVVVRLHIDSRNNCSFQRAALWASPFFGLWRLILQ
ncbi:hypothetical protein CEXT_370571 [Caerostris extrusa]|uniref:Uncharacterized protein n=1 Tax=Caerostris extrusa TaxID=172846 RepID=A0AAV4Y372_CAEEX|nr:hypothetical protein CEXT_370571 [Caerostris extrusa]